MRLTVPEMGNPHKGLKCATASYFVQVLLLSDFSTGSFPWEFHGFAWVLTKFTNSSLLKKPGHML